MRVANQGQANIHILEIFGMKIVRCSIAGSGPKASSKVRVRNILIMGIK